MTKKRFNHLLQSTLHSLVFLSLCLAPLLHNVLYNLQTETALENSIKNASKNTGHASHTKEDLSEIGLNNPLKNFWSFTRLSQRYFTQRKSASGKSTTSFSFYNKAVQSTTQSIFKTDSKILVEQSINHLADEKRYLSQAKLRLEGG